LGSLRNDWNCHEKEGYENSIKHLHANLYQLTHGDRQPAKAYSLTMTWVFWALLSAVFAAATALLAKVGVAGIDSNLATAIRTTVIVIFTWAIALGLEKQNAIAEISRRSWIFLILSGICTGLSWLCYFRALQLGPASSVAPVDKLSVVFVILGAWIFLGEGLTPMKIGGASLITIGAIVLAFA
jgi:transporter family protein